MMRAISGILQTGAVALALSTVTFAQEAAKKAPDNQPSANDTYQKQRQGNAIDNGTTAPAGAPAANPGFGPQAPNDSTLSGGQPHSNSTYQKDRNGNQGLDLGWIGLFGLAGLFGIGRGRRTDTRDVSHTSEAVRH